MRSYEFFWNLIFLKQGCLNETHHTISLILNDIQIENYGICKIECQIYYYLQDMRTTAHLLVQNKYVNKSQV